MRISPILPLAALALCISTTGSAQTSSAVDFDGAARGARFSALAAVVAPAPQPGKVATPAPAASPAPGPRIPRNPTPIPPIDAGRNPGQGPANDPCWNNLNCDYYPPAPSAPPPVIVAPPPYAAPPVVVAPPQFPSAPAAGAFDCAAYENIAPADLAQILRGRPSLLQACPQLSNYIPPADLADILRNPPGTGAYPPPGVYPPAFPPAPGYPPYPAPAYGDLRGYCLDPDHSNFEQAKAFAYSGNGLNYNDSGATQWALQYLQTHTCGTIQEYQARYQALYAYGYSGQYKNLDSNGARAFALQYVETTPPAATQAWMAQFPAVYGFFYNGNYMNLDASRSSARADSWVRRGCGDIGPVEAAFAREYGFAYGGAGLNLSASDAVRYAARQVSGMTPCYDLLQ